MDSLSINSYPLRQSTMKWLLAARWVVPEYRMDGNKMFSLWFKSTTRSWGGYCQKKLPIGTSQKEKKKRGKRKKEIWDYIRHSDEKITSKDPSNLTKIKSEVLYIALN